MVEALGIDLKEMLFAIANFLLLMAILTKFLYKPFLTNLENRKQGLKDAFDHAEVVNKRADEKMSQYEKRIAGVEQEARDILKDAKIKADRQAAQIMDEAAEKANLLLQKALLPLHAQRDLLKLAVPDDDRIVIARCDPGAEPPAVPRLKVLLCGDQQVRRRIELQILRRPLLRQVIGHHEQALAAQPHPPGLLRRRSHRVG